MKKHGTGYRGKYFTLTAMQGLHTEVIQQCVNTSRQNFSYALKILVSSEEPPPDDELELISCEETQTKGAFPCHCNCFFKRVFKLVLRSTKLLGKFISPCRKTKTGIAPPYNSYPLSHNF